MGYRDYLRPGQLRGTEATSKYRPQAQYSGLERYVPGMGLRGLSPTGQQGSDELKAKITSGLSNLANLDAVVNQAQSAYSAGLAQIQSTGVSSAVADAQSRVGGAIKDASTWVQSQINTVKAIVVPPANPMNYPISDQAWKQIDAIEVKIPSVQKNLEAAMSLLPQIYSAAQNAAGAQAAAQAQAAAAQQAQAAQKANQDVTAALLSAQSLAGQGNFAGALAALQNQNVVTAATNIGRQGDLSSAVAAITTQQANVQANQANQAAAQAAAQQAAQQAAADRAAAAANAAAQAQTQGQTTVTLTQAQLAAQQADRQFQLQLEQLRQDAADRAIIARDAADQRSREFAAAQQAAAEARADKQASQQQIFQLLPLLLKQTSAPASAGPSPLILALIQAFSSGQDLSQILPALLGAQAPATTTTNTTPAPDPTKGPGRVVWTTSEAF